MFCETWLIFIIFLIVTCGEASTKFFLMQFGIICYFQGVGSNCIVEAAYYTEQQLDDKGFLIWWFLVIKQGGNT